MCGLADVGEHTSGRDHNPVGPPGAGFVLGLGVREFATDALLRLLLPGLPSRCMLEAVPDSTEG